MLIDASPTKGLFLDTLIKDVNIKDAILDLVTMLSTGIPPATIPSFRCWLLPAILLYIYKYDITGVIFD